METPRDELKQEKNKHKRRTRSARAGLQIKGSSMIKTITSLYTELDENFRGILDRSTDSRPLLNILKFPHAELLPSLLTRALDYFDVQNNVFRINGMVLCISLEDVMFLTGLPISGNPVISHENRDPQGFSREFGLTDIANHLITNISSIAKNVNCDEAMRKKAVLLLIVKCFIVPSASGHTVNTTFLKMVQDFKLVDSFAWGPALLAFLFNGIHDCVVNKKSNLDGNSWLILDFFLLRVPKLQNLFGIELDQLNVPILSSIMEKVAVVSLKHRKDYTEGVKKIFQNLSNNDIVWTPYHCGHFSRFGESELARTTYVGPIFCNNYVHHHLPHLAAKQFHELQQNYEANTNWEPRKIKIKQNRGWEKQKLFDHYKEELGMWKAGKRAQDILRKKVVVPYTRKRRRRRDDREQRTDDDDTRDILRRRIRQEEEERHQPPTPENDSEGEQGEMQGDPHDDEEDRTPNAANEGKGEQGDPHDDEWTPNAANEGEGEQGGPRDAANEGEGEQPILD